MTKRVALTVVAVVFSLLFAFGCWLLTNTLLDRQHLSLMDDVHTIAVMESPTTGPGVEPAEAVLSNQEIADILKALGSSQTWRYHDPLDGQLTMEDAIEAAKSGLSYLHQKEILPEEIVESDLMRTNAFLYSVQLDRAAPAQAAVNPVYSFWSVSLGYREVSVKMTLNARTGQVWTADITLSAASDFDDVRALDVLAAYETYLGLSGGGALRSDEDYAIKSYDSQIGITARKTAEQSGHYQSLHFSMTLAR